MELKKSPKANLELKRNIFLEIGFIIILTIIFIAFEWKSSISEGEGLGELIIKQDFEEEIVNTFREEQPKPPPPPQAPEVIEIVSDDQEIDNEIQIEDMEAEEDMEINIEPIIQEEEEDDEEVFQFFQLEEKPEFPGGNAALLAYLQKNTHYPQIAKENDIQGTVYVGFVIDKDGSVSDVKILRSVDPYLDEEALRVVRSMPKWKPGKQRGKPVRVQYQVPIKFVLQ